MVSSMAEAAAGDAADENAPLKSQHSRRRSFVRFVNKTQRQVDIIWINYEGARIKYKTLGSEEFIDVDTFVSHPWIFRDSYTRDMLVARSSPVFCPPQWVHPSGSTRPQRYLVHITIPVYSLRERCLQVVRGMLTRHEHAFQLGIPANLQQELAARSCAGPPRAIV